MTRIEFDFSGKRMVDQMAGKGAVATDLAPLSSLRGAAL